MMKKKKKKKKLKIKYKNIKFKLSSRQIVLIERYCWVHKTTRNKVIKSAIKDFLRFNDTQIEQNYITKNQLQLFDETEHQKSL